LLRVKNGQHLCNPKLYTEGYLQKSAVDILTC
jgi:hypothetical protein